VLADEPLHHVGRAAPIPRGDLRQGPLNLRVEPEGDWDNSNDGHVCSPLCNCNTDAIPLSSWKTKFNTSAEKRSPCRSDSSRFRIFRGIANLDWKPGSTYCCLNGAGDSGKSTLLDADQLLEARSALVTRSADAPRFQSVQKVQMRLRAGVRNLYLPIEYKRRSLMRMPFNQPPPLSEEVASVLKSAQDLVHWIAERQDGLEIKSGNTTRVPGALLDLCIEHQVGIAHLVTGRMNGSAFALIRPQFEALVRALWLSLCASPEEVQFFIDKDHLPLYFWQMVEAIEKHDDFDGKVLSGIKKEEWKAMHGYTHGGMHQIARRIKENSIEPSYEPEEIIEVLKATGTFALIALQQIGRLASNDQVIADVNKRLGGDM